MVKVNNTAYRTMNLLPEQNGNRQTVVLNEQMPTRKQIITERKCHTTHY